MKKVAIGLGVLLLVSVALLAGLSHGGVNLFGVGFTWNSAKAELEKQAASFLEDLQYKDYEKSAKYHTHADQKKVNIPKLIEGLFKVKPEQLNIHNIRITGVTFDKSGKRARTFFKTDMELLNTKRNPQKDKNRKREVEGILYWHKRPLTEALPPEAAKAIPPSEDGEPAEKWFMMLEESLH